MSAPASAPASAPGHAKSSLMSVKLKRKRATTDFDGPILVRFPHGPPAQVTRPQESDEDADIEFKMYAHSDERKASQRILLVDTPGVQYAGQNYGAPHQSYKANQNQYAIGIFDAAKAKVKIVSVNHVYKLDQHVRALDAMDVQLPSDVSSSATFQTKQRVLADTFGSKKTQKRLASRAANEVTVQESTSQVLTHAVGSIQPNEMEEESTLLDAIHTRVLPKFDETAQGVRDIYPLASVLPDAVADAMGPQYKAWRSVLKKGTSGVKKHLASEAPLTTSQFVINRMNALAALEGSAERDPEQVKLLAYFDLLLRFRNGGKNKRKLVTEWPVEMAADRVKDQLMADFTVSAPTADGVPRAVYDGQCEQKVLCYLAVMSVRLSNFHLDASQIDAMATDLRMMTTDMLKYYLEAGCTASKVSIKLTAPLKLPKLRKKIERK